MGAGQTSPTEDPQNLAAEGYLLEQIVCHVCSLCDVGSQTLRGVAENMRAASLKCNVFDQASRALSLRTHEQNTRITVFVDSSYRF